MLIGDLLRQIQESPEGGWLEKLAVNRDGKPLSTPSNIILVLENSVAMKNVVALDEFAQQVVILSTPPWPSTGPYPRAIGDVDVTFAQAWMEEAYRVVADHKGLFRALVAVAGRHPVDPAKAWLESLRWDGTERLSFWLSHYLGAAQTTVTSAVGRAWMVSAVARIYEPGCQVDHVLVLEGNQGAGKSSALRILGGEWFSDDLADLTSKDSAIALCGKWIVEFGELENLRRSEITQVKAWLTRRVDRFRAPYSITAQDIPRRCVFAATTNESGYLRDPTGNRRFWPVAIGRLERDALIRDRGQLWAEAVTAFKAKEAWGELADNIVEEIRSEQEDRREVDAWEEPVVEFLEGRIEVTSTELLRHIGVARERQTRVDQMRIGNILRAQHWRRERKRIEGKLTWVYRPGVPTVPTVPISLH